MTGMTNKLLTIVCGITLALMPLLAHRGHTDYAFACCAISIYCAHWRMLREARENAKFRQMFQKSMGAAIEKKYGFGFKRDEEAKSDAEAKGH